MLRIYAALAEKERSMISERTRDALAKAKQRRVVLGNPNVGKMNTEAAAARDAKLKPWGLHRTAVVVDTANNRCGDADNHVFIFNLPLAIS
jgi:DNA invertase Pin-like site-specific DNA recombinase